MYTYTSNVDDIDAEDKSTFSKMHCGYTLGLWDPKIFKALFSAEQSSASAVPGLFRIRLAEIFADVGQVSW